MDSIYGENNSPEIAVNSGLMELSRRAVYGENLSPLSERGSNLESDQPNILSRTLDYLRGLEMPKFRLSKRVKALSAVALSGAFVAAVPAFASVPWDNDKVGSNDNGGDLAPEFDNFGHFSDDEIANPNIQPDTSARDSHINFIKANPQFAANTAYSAATEARQGWVYRQATGETPNGNTTHDARLERELYESDKVITGTLVDDVRVVDYDANKQGGMLDKQVRVFHEGKEMLAFKVVDGTLPKSAVDAPLDTNGDGEADRIGYIIRDLGRDNKGDHSPFHAEGCRCPAHTPCAKIEQGNPDQPDQPDQPGVPEQPEGPDQPDQPDQPGNPDQPDQPDQPSKKTKPRGKQHTDSPIKRNSPDERLRQQDEQAPADIHAGEPEDTYEGPDVVSDDEVIGDGGNDGKNPDKTPAQGGDNTGIVTGP